MSDITAASADLEAAEGTRDQLKDALGEAKIVVADAMAALVAAAVNSADVEIKGAGEAVDYCNAEIDRITFDETNGLKVCRIKVKEAIKAMRDAARSGNAQAEEAKLADAEAELADVNGGLRDLRKARKNAEASLRRLVAGIV